MKRTWDELCDKLEKQAKEIERLKKDNQTQADINERLDIVRESKDKEIEQLRKEKEWLLNEYACRTRNTFDSINRAKEQIKEEMQQAPKE